MESNNQKHSGKWFLDSNGQHVQISDDVYRMLCKQTNRTRYLALLENRCTQSNFRKCSGDCSQCRWQRKDTYVLADDIADDKKHESINVSCEESAEKLMLRQETWRLIFHFADKASKYGSLIIRLRFQECYEVKQIACELNISSASVEYHMKKIYQSLKSHSDIFSDFI